MTLPFSLKKTFANPKSAKTGTTFISSSTCVLISPVLSTTKFLGTSKLGSSVMILQLNTILGLKAIRESALKKLMMALSEKG